MDNFLIANISCLSVLIPITIGLWKFKTLDKTLKLILLWLFFSGLTDLACYLIVYGYILPHRAGNNMIIFNLYPAIEVICISLIYQRFFTSTNRRALLGISIISILFILWQYFFNKGFEEVKSLSAGTSSLIGILYILNYFSLFLNEKIDIDYSYNHESLLWISSGVLLFFAGSFVVVAGYDIILKYKDIFHPYIFQWILRIIMNIAIFMGFYVYKRIPRND